jgi:muramoyltetrapeptide carboxypeptidase
MMMSVIGTPWFPQIDGGILFLEDIAEHPYRVERMLLQLMHTGVLARQRAIVLGDFSGYRLAPADNGYDFDEMLAYVRATLPVPVLTGLEFGHVPRRVTIPFGAHGHLACDGEQWKLTLSDYPTLQRA